MKSLSQRYQEIGTRLRLAREDAGLTQAEAAHRLGKNQSYISRCETGRRRLEVLELEAFCRLYQKSIDFFLTTE